MVKAAPQRYGHALPYLLALEALGPSINFHVELDRLLSSAEEHAFADIPRIFQGLCVSHVFEIS